MLTADQPVDRFAGRNSPTKRSLTMALLSPLQPGRSIDSLTGQPVRLQFVPNLKRNMFLNVKRRTDMKMYKI